ncbi:hypothetical protein HYC85_024552 [Camellia sinensis]|uniref:Agglutinin domain-containing protein n=1 Tax=Camellia sinensis TaxID=4442 RepID=A0A7J7GCM4_CAMSI|nr:hypothetical protein HYC85_024552 [Camellia sinensis]
MSSGVGETVLFKSVFTDKYVRPINKRTPPNDPKNERLLADGKGGTHMCLVKPHTGIDMFHIKSQETNKYWQVKSARDGWITADADANSDDGTLFDIEYFVAPVTTATAGTTTTVRLRHHYLQRYVCLCKDGDDLCLRALSDSIDKDSKDVFVCEKFQ